MSNTKLFFLKSLILFFAVMFSWQGKGQDYQFTFHEPIQNLHVDDKGFVYLISNNHICKFDGKELHNCAQVDFQISHAAIISEREQFIASDTLLYYVKNQKVINYSTFPENITVLYQHNQKLYIGTAGKGCYIKDLKTEQIIRLKNSENQFINDILVLNNKLLLALDDGISQFELNSLRFLGKQALPELIIKQIEKYQNSYILALTANGEVFKLDQNLKLLLHSNISEASLEKLSVYDNQIYGFDSQKVYTMSPQMEISDFKEIGFSNLMVYKQQLFGIKQKTLFALDLFKSTLNISKNYALFAENDTTLWVGSEGKILKIVNGILNDEINLPATFQKTYISSLSVVGDKVFAGTMGSGLFVYRKNKQLVKHLLFENEDNLKNIIQVQYHQNQIWVAYLNGLLILDKDSFNIIRNFDNLLEDSYLYSFIPINQDDFYLGTSNKGIVHYNHGKIQSFFKGSSVYSLTLTSDYLVATIENKGVVMIKDYKATWLSTSTNLRSDVINNVISYHNFILIIHELGIDVYNIETNKISYLSINHLIENHLNSQTQNSNHLFLGYDNGILKLDKNLISYLDYDKLHLNPIKIFDQEIPLTQHVFNYKQNVISFSFESLDYYNPNDIFYKYRLTGLDNDWKNTTQEFVNYYNLTPGTYKFEVATGGIRDFKPQNIKSYQFTIQKPFWLLWWFRPFVFILVIGFIYFIIKWREKQIVSGENLKNAKVQFEFEQLKNQINPHFLFNSFNSLIGVIEENPQKAITVVEKLSALFRNILKFENVDMITVSEELEIAEQYFEIHKIRYQDLIQLEIHPVLKAEHKFVVPMSSQLLIENAIKHNIINQNHKLLISIYEENNFIVFQNTFHPKSQSENSTRLGLQNLIKRNELIFHQIPEFHQTADYFIVKIPYINA
jgi:ligand-binding sensor domain-containing protein